MALTLFLAACGGLGGEPRIVATVLPPTPFEAPPPQAAPDLVNGAAIYQQNCKWCHGVSGAGDGDMVTSGQVTNPGIFTDPATASDQRPTEWFGTITLGRIDKLMPPWGDALTEQQRWDVALYTYTLHYERALLERGAEMWAANCVECHGESGRGDGPRAAELTRPVGDLTDPATMVTQNDQVYATIIREGVGENMPAFQNELSPEDITAVAQYSRALALSGVDALGQPVIPPPVSTEEAPAPNATAEVGASADATAEAAATTITISGQVTNGSATGTVPADAEAVLFMFDAAFAQTQTTAPINADGNYTFANVPYDVANVYIVTINYRDRVFASEVRRAESLTQDAADGLLDLPITIYELTEDPSVIQITGMVSQVAVVGDSLEVAQVMTLTNTSDRAFSSSQTTEDGRNISVVISLPPGAIVAGLPDEQRYVVAAEQFAVLDTVPVLPGEDHLIQLVYLIPYENDAIIEQQMNYAVNGAVRLLIRPESVTVTSDQLPALGVETLGGNQYRSFGADLALSAGDVIRYDLRGAGVEVAQSGETSVVDSSTLPLIVIAFLAFVAVLISVSYLLYYRSKQQPTAKLAATPDETKASALVQYLIAQIAQLDARHEAGDIGDDEYQQQRDKLKDDLKRAMEDAP
ncbi:c-type cytochrome [Candidatus Flexifilum breve]|uniref:c-type cytochrome n=1 Tax=Candidatus Flexifilum breve TaxID=3140694 RepID=UPI0031CC9A8B